MKRLSLLTTSFFLTVSLGIYSRNLPIKLTFLEHHVIALFREPSVAVQKRLGRSLNKVLDKTKNLHFFPMTKDLER